MTTEPLPRCRCGGEPIWLTTDFGGPKTRVSCYQCGRITCMYSSQRQAIQEWRKMNEPDENEWVTLRDPNHVIRECDWLTHRTSDRWNKCSMTVGYKIHSYPDYNFRCRRKDLPATPEPPQNKYVGHICKLRNGDVTDGPVEKRKGGGYCLSAKHKGVLRSWLDCGLHDESKPQSPFDIVGIIEDQPPQTDQANNDALLAELEHKLSVHPMCAAMASAAFVPLMHEQTNGPLTSKPGWLQIKADLEAKGKRLIEKIEARQELFAGDDGFVAYWPSTGGSLSSGDLRIIADELDRRNEGWQKQIEEDMSKFAVIDNGDNPNCGKPVEQKDDRARLAKVGCWHITEDYSNSDPHRCRKPCVGGTMFCEDHQPGTVPKSLKKPVKVEEPPRLTYERLGEAFVKMCKIVKDWRYMGNDQIGRTFMLALSEADQAAIESLMNQPQSVERGELQARAGNTTAPVTQTYRHHVFCNAREHQPIGCNGCSCHRHIEPVPVHCGGPYVAREVFDRLRKAAATVVKRHDLGTLAPGTGDSDSIEDLRVALGNVLEEAKR